MLLSYIFGSRVLLYFFQYLPESNKPFQINFSMVFQNNSFSESRILSCGGDWKANMLLLRSCSGIVEVVVEAVTAPKVWWSLLHHSNNPKWGTVARNLFFLVTVLLPWHQNRDSHKLYTCHKNEFHWFFKVFWGLVSDWANFVHYSR